MTGFNPVKRFTFVALVLTLTANSLAQELIPRDDDTPAAETETHAGSKTFHWLATMAMLLILPSIACAFSWANRFASSVFLQVIAAVYAVFEALFLSFPDMNGVENRTSKGTAWFLAFFYCFTILVGGLASGSSAFISEDTSSRWVALAGQKTLTRAYKACSLLVTMTGWVKTSLAPVAMFGFCREAHTGQCIAHGIMGSAFVMYGLVYIIVLVIPWLRNGDGQKKSQEYYDSIVMCAWGIVNTFTEHRWGREGWSHGDYQHTSMGIIWWAGGLLGIWFTRNGARSFIPSLLLIFTGYAMSQHAQHLEISTKVHAMFGYALILGGFSRIAEISFLLRDDRADKYKIISFQYLPSFALIESGILFMGANEEQLDLVVSLGADHSSYILVLTSATFVIYLWFLLLIELYLKLEGYSSNLGKRDYEAVTDFELDSMSDDLRRETPSDA
ncbi:unnamed protein product [Kuraishia capsulata CBS 1993]|uniref:Protein YTP1-like C-terminal domain-containing protein n=1 Tax=Kuraishia capsulata CBS 1993 TaxID=1382522 RepID=W6MUX3_9ASCO|nr:uncharacterized protein KUCA_T00001941001 [Kuraishia capsulata CBS 1993]CDK25970.1 unnamed protein product [Kuraishia capsulata CBS 1993]